MIADRCPLFRDGLRRALEALPGLDVVAELDEVGEFVSRLDGTPFDVAILDVGPVYPDGLSLAGSLAGRARLLVITPDEHYTGALAALRAGALGVVSRSSSADAFVDAVRAVAGGQAWVPPALQAQMLQKLRGASVELTPREREIIACVARGLRNAEIARLLFVSEATVKTHLNNVFNKLEIRDRVGLTLYALRMGLVSAAPAVAAPGAQAVPRDWDGAAPPAPRRRATGT